MNQTITITTETIIDKLGDFFYRLNNFDASQIVFSGVATAKDFDFELFSGMLASESVLAREWNSPEEDNAWEGM